MQKSRMQAIQLQLVTDFKKFSYNYRSVTEKIISFQLQIPIRNGTKLLFQLQLQLSNGLQKF